MVTLAGGAIALATLVWSGHAGATEGTLGTLHRVGDIAHMIAGAVWLGGIFALGRLLHPPKGSQSDGELALAVRALSGLAKVGTILVIVVLATGTLNTYAILGKHVNELIASAYGRLVLIKVALVGVMLLIAANNRWQLTPALDQATDNTASAAAWMGLRKSVATEAGIGITILAIVAWLGTLAPFPSSA